jgi:nitronate monooxygenase
MQEARMTRTTSTPFTRLVGCELPIELAPIGAAGQTTRLALAVTRAGGHAMYPGVFLTAAELSADIDELRAETQAFGVNFIAPLLDRECLELAAERAPVVEFFYGDPDPELVDVVHRGGALASWQVGSAEEAVAAVACGCDLVVAQGTEAGGRVRGNQELAHLLDEVAPAVEVPVVAAGGIATAAHVRAAFAGGADAVRVGTRFVAAVEADAHPAWQQALVVADADESVTTRAFSAGVPDFPHRVLRRSLEAVHRLQADTVGSVGMRDGTRRMLPRYCSELATRDFEGAVEAMPFYAGRSVGDVRAVQPAAEIVAELAAGVRVEEMAL